MHSEGLIHRDIKPSNLLVDSEGSLRICDFGWACRETDMSVGVCGSPQYAPPEQVTIPMMIHTSKSDMYSLGATLQHFYLGRIPYSRHDWPHGRSEEGPHIVPSDCGREFESSTNGCQILECRLETQTSTHRSPLTSSAPKACCRCRGFSCCFSVLGGVCEVVAFSVSLSWSLEFVLPLGCGA